MRECGEATRAREKPAKQRLAGGRIHSGVVQKSKPVELSWDRRSRHAPRRHARTAGGLHSHPAILRPEGFDPLGNVTVIDVAAVDFEEIAERGCLVSCALP